MQAGSWARQLVGAMTALLFTAAVSSGADEAPSLYAAAELRTIAIDFEGGFESVVPAVEGAPPPVAPARLTVDDQPSRRVGVTLLGRGVEGQSDLRLPWSLVLDADDKEKRLLGAAATEIDSLEDDPSLLRRLAFLWTASEFLPAPRANLVSLVVDGRPRGLHLNRQPVDREFTGQWLEMRGGTRWTMVGDGALRHRGLDLTAYRDYRVDAGESDEAWKDLLLLCEMLETAPLLDMDTQLEVILNVDRAIWLLALETAWGLPDGYVASGGGCVLFREPRLGRFQLFPTGMRAVGATTSSTAWGAVTADPFAGAERTDRPMMSRLLAHPRLRARYASHLKTVARDVLDWSTLSGILAPLREEILRTLDGDPAARAAFIKALEGDGTGSGESLSLREYCSRRREFLLSHPELASVAPRIAQVDVTVDGATRRRPPHVGDAVRFNVSVTREVPVEWVALHFNRQRHGAFERLEMGRVRSRPGENSNEVFTVLLPTLPAGTEINYYVEASAAGEPSAVSYWPYNTEMGARSLRIEAVSADGSMVRINEVMPANKTAVRDPQGEYDDWIELVNISDAPVDISGMYLTDNPDRLRKWQFPVGTVIGPHQWLVVWADENTKSLEGLHTNFKLDVDGERVMLIDRDDRNNQILDEVRWPKLHSDVGFGRSPEGVGDFHPLIGTPGAKNPDHR